MIRELRKADGPQVFHLLKTQFPEEEAYLGTRPEGVEKVFRRVFRWDTQFFLALARLFGRPLFRFFLVEEDGKVVATTLLSYGERSGYVSMVVVDPAYRRRGLAQALLERARAATQASGRKYIALDVLAQNTPARTLYERIGYLPLREATFFTRDPDAPLSGAPSPAIRPFRPEDAKPLAEIAQRSLPAPVAEVLPIRAGTIRGSGFGDKILESRTNRWVVDRGHGPEAYLSATVSAATEASHFGNPIVGEGVTSADAAALVRTGIDWCIAGGAPRIVGQVPVANVRGRAALLEGGFHEAIAEWTLYRPTS
jgi:ribosomal protein S18 acetylase RimI-like enzyme